MFQILFLITLITGTYQQINSPNVTRVAPNLINMLQPGKKVDNTRICGYSNPDGINTNPLLEIPSNETKYGEYPWIVAILEQDEQYSTNPSYHYQCAGSLIHPSVVLTAASCVYQKPLQNFIVRTGEWNLNAKLEEIPEQDQYINEIIIHDQYNNDNSNNDIALIFFTRPFHINRNIVRPICLPTDKINFDLNQCTIVGWGSKNRKLYRRPENFLKKIENLTIFSHGDCQLKLRTNKYGRNYQLSQTLLCANDEGDRFESACGISDEGSPLICKIHGTMNRYYQVGIVTRKIECDYHNPGLYANLPVLRSWIDKVLGLRNIDGSYFTPDAGNLGLNSTTSQSESSAMYAL